MRVALFTTSRFWLAEHARELAALGHESLLYSLVPPGKLIRHGLPAANQRWLGPYVAPLYAAHRVLRSSASEHALVAALDHVAAKVIEPCDVLISMSGIGVRVLDAARRRHRARIFVERASRHILSQREILESIAATARQVSDWTVDRELAGYGLADVITVPSSHVAASFRERDFPAGRLFQNPFGASLDMFRATPAPKGAPTILMTGAWSLRKGCDVLVDAWRRLPGTRLLHVGPVVDAPLPTDPGFEHVDAVPQGDLASYYSMGHVFALASREEGLALVQVQALACGLPLVCTTRTGGEDLRAWCTDPCAIRVVPPDDPQQLADALAAALQNMGPPGQMRDLLGAHREETSWRAYAQRYEARMLQELGKRP